MPDIQKCLHCTIRDAALAWIEIHGRKPDGQHADVGEVINGLAEVIGEFVEMPDDRNQRRRALRHAHAALDAGAKAARTGQAQPLDLPTEH